MTWYVSEIGLQMSVAILAAAALPAAAAAAGLSIVVGWFRSPAWMPTCPRGKVQK